MFRGTPSATTRTVLQPPLPPEERPQTRRPPSPRTNDMCPNRAVSRLLGMLVGRRREEADDNTPEVVSTDRALRRQDCLIRDTGELERLGGVAARDDAAGWWALIRIECPC